MTVPLRAGVVAAGGLGSVSRFLLDRGVAARIARSFPIGTLSVNLSGAILLGAIGGRTAADLSLLAGTAFVGATTTFCTRMLETQRLAEQRMVWPAVTNVAVSVLLGTAAAGLGLPIGEHL